MHGAILSIFADPGLCLSCLSSAWLPGWLLLLFLLLLLLLLPGCELCERSVCATVRPSWGKGSPAGCCFTACLRPLFTQFRQRHHPQTSSEKKVPVHFLFIFSSFSVPFSFRWRSEWKPCCSDDNADHGCGCSILSYIVVLPLSIYIYIYKVNWLKGCSFVWF